MTQRNDSERSNSMILLGSVAALLIVLFCAPRTAMAQPPEILQSFEQVPIGGLTFYVRRTAVLSEWRQIMHNILSFEASDLRASIPEPIFRRAKTDIVFVLEDERSVSLTANAVYVHSGRSPIKELQSLADLFGNPAHMVIIFGPHRRFHNFSTFGTVLVHEVSHYFHFIEYNRINGIIERGYADMMNSGKYREHPSGVLILRNHWEYFAEISRKFFSLHHTYPRNRGELKAYDLPSYCLVRLAWNLSVDPDC